MEINLQYGLCNRLQTRFLLRKGITRKFLMTNVGIFEEYFEKYPRIPRIKTQECGIFRFPLKISDYLQIYTEKYKKS